MDQVFFGNTVQSWLIALGIVLGAMLVLRIVGTVVISRIKKITTNSKTTWDDFIINNIEASVIPLCYVFVIYIALNTLHFSPAADKVIHIAWLVVLTYFLLRIITAAFKKFVHSFINRNNEDGTAKEKQASGLIIIVNIIIWLLGVVFLIDNLGYNITTLIAGLGIGGIAIALAAQTILGDLFSYFVIFFDRPFEIGDFVVVQDKSGVVEYIGIKTTRLRTLGGEQLICSNTDLTNSRLHNYKRMERRRVVFTIGVTYQTTHAQLAQIPQIVKDIITAKEDVTYDRGHLSAYAASSLNFEFVYYVENADYNMYMDIQQQVYLDIYAAFGQHNIDFAYPTQTVFIQRETQPQQQMQQSNGVQTSRQEN